MSYLIHSGITINKEEARKEFNSVSKTLGKEILPRIYLHDIVGVLSSSNLLAEGNIVNSSRRR